VGIAEHGILVVSRTSGSNPIWLKPFPALDHLVNCSPLAIRNYGPNAALPIVHLN